MSLRLPAVIELGRPLESGVFAGVALLGMTMTSGSASLAAWLLVPLAVVGLAVFGFAYNDVCDAQIDALSNKRHRPLVAGHLSCATARAVCVAVLAASVLALYLVAPTPAVAMGLLTAVAGWLYSSPRARWKSVPLVSSLLHVISGAAAFVVGAWSMVLSFDAPLMGMYFGLVFAAGHLHHEVADGAADRAGGLKTTATWLGERRALWLGFGVWTVAAVYFSLLALGGVVSAPVGVVQLVMYLAYLASFAHARRHRPERAVGVMRAWYRPVYWVGGLSMVLLTW